jgi:cation diffusion facilitator family transporter
MQRAIPRPVMVDPIRLRRRAVLVCIATTAAVAALELVVGRWFGLLSVTGEGVHTAADLADSLVVFVLVAMAARPADRDHPFGHGKFDSLAGIIEGTCVGLAAVWVLVKSALVLTGVDEAHPRPEAASLAAMALACAVYVPMSAYVLRLARRTGSPAVYAEAMHLQTHIYITIGLLCGLALTRLGQARGWALADHLDAAVALLLGLVLVGISYRVIVPGFRQMMDTAIPSDELERITACIGEFRSEFVEVHGIRSRQAGTDRYMHIDLMVHAEMSVQRAHDLAHRIEARLQELDPRMNLVVHVEPAVGQALEDYADRHRVGMVFAGEESPDERESIHHGPDEGGRT